MKLVRKIRLSAIVLTCMAVSGCVGGTTYGTGVGQEEQTLNDITNMLTLKKKKNTIDYSARSDLIVPEQKDLVQPVEVASTTSNTDWPETPADRIAKLRKSAEEAEHSPAKKAEHKKLLESLRSSGGDSRYTFEAPIGEGIPNETCDPDGKIMRACTKEEISTAARAFYKRANNSPSGSRRYLTEPPTEYRTASGTAPIGDEGFTPKEIEDEERRKKERYDVIR